ncbi:Protein GLC8 [Neolecta irregularis DAH-3]|uniref:Protein GLC8 n=1 Tax=Neolecta irregularis (strain DAH-3) TaxID=1198029 RepID=A0A1U7LQU5_NEOID|nr:Protein GLC8 [Neolecta irregularis DAH-3]|eukprot:OLL24953.1 Protein GLC8 [Neolecta irregularis DAH-3]
MSATTNSIRVVSSDGESQNYTRKPKSILKNPSERKGPSVINPAIVSQNTHLNAHSTHLQPAIRSSHEIEISPRLKWDEANLYLTEQDRTATMKIMEPKTPYAGRYDPSQDPDDDDESMVEGIPSLSLGEPEESIPAHQRESSPKQVVVTPAEPDKEEEEEEEDQERHKHFAEMRKKHYEMKNALKLRHQLETQEDDEDMKEVLPSNIPQELSQT